MTHSPRRPYRIVVVALIALALLCLAPTMLAQRPGPRERVLVEPTLSPEPTLPAERDFRLELASVIGGQQAGIAVDGDRAVMGVEDRLHLVDLSDPAYPRFLAASPTLPGTIEAVAIQDDVAFCMSVGYSDTIFGGCDFSDPDNPVLLPRLVMKDDEEGCDLTQVVGGLTLARSDHTWVLYDVSDPAMPLALAGGRSPGVNRKALTANAVWVLGDNLAIWERVEPWHVVERPHLEITGDTIAAQDDALYVLDDTILSRYTITDTVNLTLEDQADLGVTGNYLYPNGDQLFIAGGCHLTVVDITPDQPMTLTCVSDVNTWSREHIQSHYGDMLYISGDGRLLYVDISDPTNPQPVRKDEVVRDVLLARDGLAYRSLGDDLLVLDMSEPDWPHEIGRAEGIGSTCWGAFDGDYLYLTGPDDNDDGPLLVVDVSDPTTPISVGFHLDWVSGPSAVYEDHLYTMDRDYPDVQLLVADVSDPVRPVALASAEWRGGSNEQQNLVVDQGRLYAGNLFYWQVFDLTDPARPAPMLDPDRDACDFGAPFWPHNGRLLINKQWEYDVHPFSLWDAAEPCHGTQLWGVAASARRQCAAWLDDDYAIGHAVHGLLVGRLDEQGIPYVYADNPDRLGLGTNKLIRDGDLIYAYGNNRWKRECQVLRIVDEEIADPTPSHSLRLPLVLKGTPGASEMSSAALVVTGDWRIVDQLGGWAYDVAVEDGIAYLAMGPRLITLDVTDPSDMRPIGETDVLDGLAQDLCLVEEEGAPSLAYVALADQGGMKYWDEYLHSDLDRFGGLAIVDVSDPADPRVLGKWLTDARCRGVVVSGTLACVAQREGDVALLDVSDPIAPELITHIDTPSAEDVALYGDWLYVSSLADEMLAFNIADPFRPMCTYHKDDYAALGLAVEDGILFMARYSMGSYALTDPGYPELLDSALSRSDVYHITIRDGLASVSSRVQDNEWPVGGASGYSYVMDISDPADIRKVVDGGRWYGTTDIYSSTVFVAQGAEGLLAVDISDPSDPIVVGQYENVGEAFRMVYPDHGESAVVHYQRPAFRHENALAEVSVGQSGLSLRQWALTTDERLQIATEGEWLFGAQEYEMYWELYSWPLDDLTDTPNVLQLSRNEPGWATAFWVNDGLATLFTDHWITVDVTDPVSPTLVDDVAFPYYYAMALPTVENDLLYMRYWSDSLSGARAIRIDPHEPELVGSVGSGGMSTGMAKSGDYLLFANPAQGLIVADASDPENMRMVRAHKLDSAANFVNAVGDEVHVSTQAGVLVLDAAALPEMRVLGEYTTPGSAEFVHEMADGRLLVGDGYGGVVLLERATD